MNQLMTTGVPATMSSREIAELTSKELAHVHRDIRSMIEQLADDPELDHVREDKDSRGYTTCFYLTKALTMTLVAGYNVKLRKAIIDRWQELEANQLKPVELSRMDILRIAMESEEARIKAETERDHAIATKAQIGSKREATAMAAASAAKREVLRLKDELGVNQRHATIIAVENALGIKFDSQFWRNLKRWCDSHGITAAKVTDPRWGEVKAWPAEAWKEVHGVDLASIFPAPPGMAS